jgi:hypothetical protein
MAPEDSGMISQKLQRHHSQHRLQNFRCIRNGDELVCMLFDILITFRGDYYNLSTACPDLRYIAHNLVILWTRSCNENRRHTVIY